MILALICAGSCGVEKSRVYHDFCNLLEVTNETAKQGLSRTMAVAER